MRQLEHKASVHTHWYKNKYPILYCKPDTPWLNLRKMKGTEVLNTVLEFNWERECVLKLLGISTWVGHAIYLPEATSHSWWWTMLSLEKSNQRSSSAPGLGTHTPTQRRNNGLILTCIISMHLNMGAQKYFRIFTRSLLCLAYTFALGTKKDKVLSSSNPKLMRAGKQYWFVLYYLLLWNTLNCSETYA